MGTYYHENSEIQGDGLQTLILMNPGYNVGYSDTTLQQPQSSGNYGFLNSSNSLNHTHAPPTQQLPLSATASAAQQQDHLHHPSIFHSHHDISTLHTFMPRLQYSLYNPVDLMAARDVTQSHRGLSLTLSSIQQPGYQSFQTDRQLSSPAPAPTHLPTISLRSRDDARLPGGSSSSVSGVSNGVNGMQSVVLSSKYLKAAQELLDEVVNVDKGVKASESAAIPPINSNTKNDESSGDGASSNGGEVRAKRVAELTTAERQEIQLKKAKLVNMLDGVEQRYRQYHNQMQLLISWFEQAAGIGSAKTYTALALQTISKQFRCLKDAIMGQIQAASKRLGEENSLGGGKLEGSRLKFVDNELRQQRALQQLGMIQHNAWRPQRGLPERSVTVLRAWLFEHFLHPYPKDSDKQMLAKQTGLTRSQVSNWFINARVRLWKPMVEEMYKEEVKEQERNGSEDKTSKSEHNEEMATKGRATQEKNPKLDSRDNPSSHNYHLTISGSGASTSPTGLNMRNHSGFTLTGSSEMEEMMRGSPKKPRSTDIVHSSADDASLMNMESKPEVNNEQMHIKFGNDQRQTRDGFTLMASPTNYIRGFGSYPMGDVGRFSADQFSGAPYSANGISLTLGLPHGENLSISGTHQSFIPNQNIQLERGVDIGKANEYGALETPTSSHSSIVYDNMNMQSRKRFAAQLLPDFVA